MSYRHCNGQHDLLPLMIRRGDPGVEDVVRWCQNCGAVVIDTDVDVDGRVMRGASMRMAFPRIAQAHVSGVMASEPPPTRFSPCPHCDAPPGHAHAQSCPTRGAGEVPRG